MKSTTLTILLALLTACGGGGGGGDDDGIDGDATDPDAEIEIDAAEGVVLDIRGEGAALLAARQGTDPWELLTADAQGRVLYPVERQFEIVGVCTTPAVRIVTVAGGPQDGVGVPPDTFDVGCPRVWNASVDLVNSSGQILIVFAGLRQHTVPAQQSSLAAFDAGVHDIGIYNATTHVMAIRRNVTLVDGMTLPIDLGGAMPLVQRQITGHPAGSRILSFVNTASGTLLRLESDGTVGWMLPAALAASGDRHSITAREDETAGIRSRYATHRVDVNDTSTLTITAPPHLASATLTWDQSPTATYDTSTWTVGRDTLNGVGQITWVIHAFPNAARTAGTLAAPSGLSDIPGWDPAWYGLTGNHLLNLTLRRDTANQGTEGVLWTLDRL